MTVKHNPIMFYLIRSLISASCPVSALSPALQAHLRLSRPLSLNTVALSKDSATAFVLGGGLGHESLTIFLTKIRK